MISRSKRFSLSKRASVKYLPAFFIKGSIIQAMTSNTSAQTLKIPRFKIQIINRQRRFSFQRKSVSLFCAAVLRSLDQPTTTLSVALVESREIRLINFRYRQKDYATDVLSFNYGSDVIEGSPFLGEIVIAPEVAANQAIRHHVSPEKELRKLLLHGILHLLGYDHESEGCRMSRLQTKLMRRKFFTDGLPFITQVPR